MPSKQGLFLAGTPEQLDQLIRDVEHELPPGWSRNREREAAVGEMICFTCTASAGRPAAEIWLSITRTPPASLNLATALSLDSDRLTQQEFEAVTTEFVTYLLEPTARHLNIEIVFNPKEPSAPDRMPGDVFQELYRYTLSANKGSCNGHPRDHECWIRFVVSAYIARAEVDGVFLQSWFAEHGWDTRNAIRLGADFDEAWAALAEYDRRQALSGQTPR